MNFIVELLSILNILSKKALSNHLKWLLLCQLSDYFYILLFTYLFVSYAEENSSSDSFILVKLKRMRGEIRCFRNSE